MTRSDDMVIRPALDAPDLTPARTEARERRVLEKTRRSRLLERARQARRLRQARARLRSRSSARRFRTGRGTRAARGVRNLASTGGRFAARRGAAAAVSNPIGLIVTALVVAAVVGTRIATDTPFEGMGLEVNRVLLGNLDERARAAAAVRGQLSGDPNLARIVGQTGSVPTQVAKIGEDLLRFEQQRQEGRTALEERFPVNGVADFLVLRAVELWNAAWRSKDLSSKVADARAKIDGLTPEKGKGAVR